MSSKSPNLLLLPALPKNRRFVLGIFGFCLGTFGLLYGIFWEVIFNCLVEKALVLRPNSKIFEVWKTPPLKITLDMYLFNWTNPEDFYNPAVKPNLQELGPYRFTEVPHKVALKWHPENASLSYRKQNFYYFDAETSVGTLEDQIVTLNSLAVAIAKKTKNWNSMKRALIDIALKASSYDIAIKKSVNELLFGGYEDVLVSLGNSIPSSITDVFVPFDRFGYCYPRNGSSELSGVFNMYTGAGDKRRKGQLHSWNNKMVTSFFPSECAHVRGSPGEFQPADLQQNTVLELFVTEFCRSVKLDYVDVDVVEGIQGYKYHGGPRMVDNGTLYPENACYCNGVCVPSGVLNISSCWYGAPLFISYPHFYNADPYYGSQFVGLKPAKEKHELQLIIEPKTGLTLDVRAKVQANILVEPVPYLRMLRNAPKLFFPLFWGEERVRITPELAAELKRLPLFVLCGQILGGICFAVGLALFLWHPLMERIQHRLLHHIKISELQSEPTHIKGNIGVSAPEISLLLKNCDKEIGILPSPLNSDGEYITASMIVPFEPSTNALSPS